MTERRPALPRGPTEATAPRWDPGAIGAALDPAGEARTVALPSPTPDDDAGLGIVLGDPPRLALEIFPAQQHVVLRSPGLRVELEGIEPPTIGTEGVVFERTSPTQALWLSLGRSGEFALQSAPITPATLESPTIASGARDDATGPIGGPHPEIAVARHSAAPDGVSDPSSPTTRSEGKEDKQERVKVFGRLATDVRFKTHAAGRLIGEFVLAERLDEEHTRWHKVAAFDNPQTERFVASKLKQLVDAGEIARGKTASVVGYVHRTERAKRDGTTKTEEQIYAVAISPR